LLSVFLYYEVIMTIGQFMIARRVLARVVMCFFMTLFTLLLSFTFVDAVHAEGGESGTETGDPVALPVDSEDTSVPGQENIECLPGEEEEQTCLPAEETSLEQENPETPPPVDEQETEQENLEIPPPVEEPGLTDDSLPPDPRFCSSGTPAGGTCSPQQVTIADALTDAASSAGTIYLEQGQTFTETITISGRSLDLTFSGGWNFSSNTQGTTTTLNAPISIDNSTGTIYFKNILFGANAWLALQNSPAVVVDGTSADDTLRIIVVNGVSSTTFTINGGSGTDKINIGGDLSQFSLTATDVDEVNITDEDQLTLGGNIVTGGGDLNVTAEEITVSNNVLISTRAIVNPGGGNHLTAPSTGDSGNIVFSGERITLGDISLQAVSNLTIKALSLAAAIAADAGKPGAAGGGNSFKFSGGGAEATNTIVGGTEAYVLNSLLDSAGNILLVASNTSTIKVVVLGVTGTVAWGEAAAGIFWILAASRPACTLTC
jgi:hypothetical protein